MSNLKDLIPKGYRLELVQYFNGKWWDAYLSPIDHLEFGLGFNGTANSPEKAIAKAVKKVKQDEVQ